MIFVDSSEYLNDIKKTTIEYDNFDDSNNSYHNGVVNYIFDQFFYNSFFNVEFINLNYDKVLNAENIWNILDNFTKRFESLESKPMGVRDLAKISTIFEKLIEILLNLFRMKKLSEKSLENLEKFLTKDFFLKLFFKVLVGQIKRDKNYNDNFKFYFGALIQPFKKVFIDNSSLLSVFKNNFLLTFLNDLEFLKRMENVRLDCFFNSNVVGNEEKSGNKTNDEKQFKSEELQKMFQSLYSFLKEDDVLFRDVRQLLSDFFVKYRLVVDIIPQVENKKELVKNIVRVKGKKKIILEQDESHEEAVYEPKQIKTRSVRDKDNIEPVKHVDKANNKIMKIKESNQSDTMLNRKRLRDDNNISKQVNNKDVDLLTLNQKKEFEDTEIKSNSKNSPKKSKKEKENKMKISTEAKVVSDSESLKESTPSKNLRSSISSTPDKYSKEKINDESRSKTVSKSKARLRIITKKANVGTKNKEKPKILRKKIKKSRMAHGLGLDYSPIKDKLENIKRISRKPKSHSKEKIDSPTIQKSETPTKNNSSILTRKTSTPKFREEKEEEILKNSGRQSRSKTPEKKITKVKDSFQNSEFNLNSPNTRKTKKDEPIMSSSDRSRRSPLKINTSEEKIKSPSPKTNKNKSLYIHTFNLKKNSNSRSKLSALSEKLLQNKNNFKSPSKFNITPIKPKSKSPKKEDSIKEVLSPIRAKKIDSVSKSRKKKDKMLGRKRRLTFKEKIGEITEFDPSTPVKALYSKSKSPKASKTDSITKGILTHRLTTKENRLVRKKL